MARSLSNAKLFSAALVDGISASIARRGYAAAASQGVASSFAKTGATRSAVMPKKAAEEVARPTERVSWVPDPKTGYYRPENRAQEIDVAELRAVLLKNKNNAERERERERERKSFQKPRNVSPPSPSRSCRRIPFLQQQRRETAEQTPFFASILCASKIVVTMARSLSNAAAKLFSAALVDGVSASIARRGYATAASQGVASSLAKTGAATRSTVMSKKAGEEVARPAERVSWVPDPKTGYYRPENRPEEIDVAELRAMLLKNKN
ncbi:uncharacterized protein LOC115694099 [Syzygium oleosum]|uniref:uncharacterized protein LOC115694099 n=1 Tax=Syzygium oleosum TaxID=219896 RepID=UPI0024BAD491|nr:uncharacterized protein LOC115694099 [Syzygium oleosum]